ncbi:ABC transporter permease [Gordonia zhaorongruii]|uniref:ABC transporter permease n=1 Tax=Gordonia zhaorongruii TaxID=2597659 RepID=UPI0010455234|nr:ABC transporter permease [Gordonia zhaorongruii]
MTAPAASAPAVFDSPGIPLTRLIKVELRKLVDTRAGFALTASIGAISAIIAVVKLATGSNDPAGLNFGSFFQMMTIPMGILLPILAILLVTSEWSQRGALTTFTMEPRRERIIIAKLAATLIAGLGAIVVALIFGAIGNLLAGLAYNDPAGSWEIPGSGLLNAVLLQVIGMLMGFAFAALILHTAGAIIAYFAVPTVMSLISELIPWFRENLTDWIDLGHAQIPLQEADAVTGGEWARIVVAVVIWVAIPLFFGINRVMRSEIK